MTTDVAAASPHSHDIDVEPPALAIGFDIGGTKISGGVLTSDGREVDRIAPRTTPPDQDGILATLVEMSASARERHPQIAAIGVGTAGLVEFPGGFIRWAPNNGYDQMPLRSLLEVATGLAVIVDNDANAAAWAEARLGRSAHYMLFVTLGTGVGGGIILDGAMFRGAAGIGAEIGHIVVDPHGNHRCGCGNIGCLEALASGNALGRMGREAATQDPGGGLVRLAGSPDAVTGETVFKAARSGDRLAVSLYAELGEWLGIGLATLTTILDLELITIGGSVAAAGEMLLSPTRDSLERRLFARHHRTPPMVVSATLGVEAGWMGAALLAVDWLGTAAPIPAQASP